MWSFQGNRGRPRTSKAKVLQNAVGVELRTHPSPETGSLSLSRKVWNWSHGQGGVGCSGAQGPGPTCPPATFRHKHDGGKLGSWPSPTLGHHALPLSGDADPRRLPGALISASLPLRHSRTATADEHSPGPFPTPRRPNTAWEWLVLNTYFR